MTISHKCLTTGRRADTGPSLTTHGYRVILSRHTLFDGRATWRGPYSPMIQDIAMLEDLADQMRGRSDEELHEMLHLHRDDWTSEALDAAEREFRKREVNPTRLVELRANTEATRRHEEVAASQPLSFPLKLLFFLINPSTFCGLFVLIPVAEIAF